MCVGVTDGTGVCVQGSNTWSLGVCYTVFNRRKKKVSLHEWSWSCSFGSEPLLSNVLHLQSWKSRECSPHLYQNLFSKPILKAYFFFFSNKIVDYSSDVAYVHGISNSPGGITVLWWVFLNQLLKLISCIRSTAFLNKEKQTKPPPPKKKTQKCIFLTVSLKRKYNFCGQ